jgi:hypothetical protein
MHKEAKQRQKMPNALANLLQVSVSDHNKSVVVDCVSPRHGMLRRSQPHSCCLQERVC